MTTNLRFRLDQRTCDRRLEHGNEVVDEVDNSERQGKGNRNAQKRVDRHLEQKRRKATYHQSEIAQELTLLAVYLRGGDGQTPENYKADNDESEREVLQGSETQRTQTHQGEERRGGNLNQSAIHDERAYRTDDTAAE
ncbi:ATP-binding cassette sub-family A member 2, putative [Babesia ovata]|uniref:ATP-binding cassette sub-family A member 2, putative n=1 Tax=Babesia ovata TaxID=189622 RepID=A0A2H6KGQ7_9APIC|nr:ATP-binding cassette sub-family A member 2, putative [Babesia ovata]GBE62183.1 ATP-binding cassette sub-family A member 2, putative [Babesia ovata]